jgi:hypothetical protein
MKIFVPLTVCFLLIFPVGTMAQSNSASDFLLTSVIVKPAIGVIQISDPYLSPLTYTGTSLSFESFTAKYLSARNRKLSEESRYFLSVGALSNMSNTASMETFQAEYAWGLRHHFRLWDNFEVLTGGNVNGLLGVKYLARNVNNPVNIDLALNLNASAVLNYSFRLWKKDFKLRYQFFSPVVGCMFVPPQGSSYYEMFSLGNTGNTLHFSSFHNRLGLSQSLMLIVPLPRATIFAGIDFQQLKYKANAQVYGYNSNLLSVGFIYRMLELHGTKKSLPNNFLYPQN